MASWQNTSELPVDSPNYDPSSNRAHPWPSFAYATDSGMAANEAGVNMAYIVPSVPIWKTKVGKVLIATILILIAAIVGGSVGAATASRARCRRDTSNSAVLTCRPSATSSSSTATSAAPAPTTGIIPRDLRIQGRWEWCNKCQALAYAGFADQGPCPAGGVHNHTGSSDYPTFVDAIVIPAGYQDNWRWCSKCQALAFGGNTPAGSCSAGGVHDHARSANYILEIRSAGTLLPGRQDNWRWCNKCQVLAYAGSPSAGSCSAGGLHDTSTSYDYVLYNF